MERREQCGTIGGINHPSSRSRGKKKRKKGGGLGGQRSGGGKLGAQCNCLTVKSHFKTGKLSLRCKEGKGVLDEGAKTGRCGGVSGGSAANRAFGDLNHGGVGQGENRGPIQGGFVLLR